MSAGPQINAENITLAVVMAIIIFTHWFIVVTIYKCQLRYVLASTIFSLAMTFAVIYNFVGTSHILPISIGLTAAAGYCAFAYWMRMGARPAARKKRGR
jgi:FlaA1/EpsC-like NDP-sugar epimerase